MYLSRPSTTSGPDTISEQADPARGAIWIVALGLAAIATVLSPDRILPTASATAVPFLILAAVVAAGMAGDRIGVFRALARVLIRASAGPRLSAAAVLTFTALVSGVVNLDVAVVVAMPVALDVAQRNGLSASRLAVAVALTANATSFLLPTSNLTTLLVLTRSPLPAWTYLQASWIAWLLVTALTVGALAVVAGRHDTGTASESGRPSASRVPMLVDLIPMFVAASAIRALLGTGLVLGGGFIAELATGSLLAAVVNNLPAAAAVAPVGATGRWAAVLAMAVGPNLLLTGSVASLICRRIAHDRQAGFGAVTFTLLGTALLPAQLLVAWGGLMLTGAVG